MIRYHNIVLVKHVPSAEFDLASLEAQQERYKQISWTTINTGRVLLLAFAAYAILTPNLISFACTILVAAILVVRQIQINTWIENEQDNLWWSIQRAKKLNRLMLVYDDRRARVGTLGRT